MSRQEWGRLECIFHENVSLSATSLECDTTGSKHNNQGENNKNSLVVVMVVVVMVCDMSQQSVHWV